MRRAPRIRPGMQTTQGLIGRLDGHLLPARVEVEEKVLANVYRAWFGVGGSEVRPRLGCSVAAKSDPGHANAAQLNVTVRGPYAPDMHQHWNVVLVASFATGVSVPLRLSAP